MRNEGRGLLKSVAELIRIAREAGIPAQINHHKALGVGQWGQSERTLAMIDSARAEGLDVKHDLYPYTASSTSSRVLFPHWALAGGQDSLSARLADPNMRARIEAGMREILVHERVGDDLARVQFRTVPSDPRYDGKTLADLAADRGLPNTVDAGIPLVIELQLAGGFSGIYHVMDEEDVKRIMRHPYAMFETDGDPVAYGVGYPHPRSYGAFPRVLARYVRELGVLTLEEAIRRMTSLSAEQIGQHERGRIEAGMYADITVFDPDAIQDRATFADPHQYPFGIRHVLVNGVSVIHEGVLTGAKPGRVLEGPAREPHR
jgi:N-acyl-D-aspartate/D-glutamate deacylase